MKFYITGTRRGLGKALKDIYGCTDTLDQCDVFINCKHNGFEQVNLLYQAAELILVLTHLTKPRELEVFTLLKNRH